MRVEQAYRLKELEQENSRLRKLVADIYPGSSVKKPKFPVWTGLETVTECSRKDYGTGFGKHIDCR